MWRFLKKLEIELPYDPAIPLLGMHTEETRRERDTCTPMFIAALFIMARTWKQPRCPSADEWIRKLWYIYTMEYYSAIKKNTFESRSFIISGLMFRSLTHFEFIFVYGVRKCSNFILLQVVDQFPSTTC